MTASTRSTYHHGNLAEALLDAGEIVLAERGAHDLTLRECARRAGVSHAAPNHHFGGKATFLSHLAERGYRRLAAALTDALDAVDPAALDARLLANAEAYVGFARRQPELFRLMFRYDLLDRDSAGLEAAAIDTFVVLTNVIRSQRGEPPVAASELKLLKALPALREDVMLGWSHIHGFAHLLIEGQFGAMMDGKEDAFVHQALVGTLPRLGQTIRTLPL